MSNIISVKDESEFRNLIYEFLALESSSITYAPEVDDLYHLYSLVRRKLVTSVLEYGSGWSSLAIHVGLLENRASFAQEFEGVVRHPNLFQHLIIDADERFLNITLQRLNKLKSDCQIIPVSADCEVVNDTVANWNYLPNFVADLVYVDGPDDNQIKGNFKNWTYGGNFTTPIFEDLITLEPYFWPESLIVFDGRTAHARYVKNKFRRNWNFMHDPFGDRSIFRLDEPPFGEVSAEFLKIRLQCTRLTSGKEKPEYLRN